MAEDEIIEAAADDAIEVGADDELIEGADDEILEAVAAEEAPTSIFSRTTRMIA